MWWYSGSIGVRVNISMEHGFVPMNKDAYAKSSCGLVACASEFGDNEAFS